ncbi:MAG: ferredoxin family protein [Phycisphaerae bacterium]
MTPVRVETERCKGCSLCIEFCPQHCLTLSEGHNAMGYHVAELHNPSKCTACTLCAEMCPESGMTVYRKKRKARDSKSAGG